MANGDEDADAGAHVANAESAYGTQSDDERHLHVAAEVVTVAATAPSLTFTNDAIVLTQLQNDDDDDDNNNNSDDDDATNSNAANEIMNDTATPSDVLTVNAHNVCAVGDDEGGNDDDDSTAILLLTTFPQHSPNDDLWACRQFVGVQPRNANTHKFPINLWRTNGNRNANANAISRHEMPRTTGRMSNVKSHALRIERNAPNITRSALPQHFPTTLNKRTAPHSRAFPLHPADAAVGQNTNRKLRVIEQKSVKFPQTNVHTTNGIFPMNESTRMPMICRPTKTTTTTTISIAYKSIQQDQKQHVEDVKQQQQQQQPQSEQPIRFPLVQTVNDQWHTSTIATTAAATTTAATTTPNTFPLATNEMKRINRMQYVDCDHQRPNHMTSCHANANASNTSHVHVNGTEHEQANDNGVPRTRCGEVPEIQVHYAIAPQTSNTVEHQHCDYDDDHQLDGNCAGGVHQNLHDHRHHQRQRHRHAQQAQQQQRNACADLAHVFAINKVAPPETVEHQNEKHNYFSFGGEQQQQQHTPNEYETPTPTATTITTTMRTTMASATETATTATTAMKATAKATLATTLSAQQQENMKTNELPHEHEHEHEQQQEPPALRDDDVVVVDADGDLIGSNVSCLNENAIVVVRGVGASDDDHDHDHDDDDHVVVVAVRNANLNARTRENTATTIAIAATTTTATMPTTTATTTTTMATTTTTTCTRRRSSYSISNSDVRDSSSQEVVTAADEPSTVTHTHTHTTAAATATATAAAATTARAFLDTENTNTSANDCVTFADQLNNSIVDNTNTVTTTTPTTTAQNSNELSVIGIVATRTTTAATKSSAIAVEIDDCCGVACVRSVSGSGSGGAGAGAGAVVHCTTTPETEVLDASALATIMTITKAFDADTEEDCSIVGGVPVSVNARVHDSDEDLVNCANNRKDSIKSYASSTSNGDNDSTSTSSTNASACADACESECASAASGDEMKLDMQRNVRSGGSSSSQQQSRTNAKNDTLKTSSTYSTGRSTTASSGVTLRGDRGKTATTSSSGLDVRRERPVSMTSASALRRERSPLSSVGGASKTDSSGRGSASKRHSLDVLSKYGRLDYDTPTRGGSVGSGVMSSSSDMSRAASVDVLSAVLPERTVLRRQRRLLAQESVESPEQRAQRLNQLYSRISGALTEVKGVLKQYSTETDSTEEKSKTTSARPALSASTRSLSLDPPTATEDPVKFRFVRKIRRRSTFDEEEEEKAKANTEKVDELKVETNQNENVNNESNVTVNDSDVSKDTSEVKTDEIVQEIPKVVIENDSEIDLKNVPNVPEVKENAITNEQTPPVKQVEVVKENSVEKSQNIPLIPKPEIKSSELQTAQIKIDDNQNSTNKVKEDNANIFPKNNEKNQVDTKKEINNKDNKGSTNKKKEEQKSISLHTTSEQSKRKSKSPDVEGIQNKTNAITINNNSNKNENIQPRNQTSSQVREENIEQKTRPEIKQNNNQVADTNTTKAKSKTNQVNNNRPKNDESSTNETKSKNKITQKEEPNVSITPKDNNTKTKDDKQIKSPEVTTAQNLVDTKKTEKLAATTLKAEPAPSKTTQSKQEHKGITKTPIPNENQSKGKVKLVKQTSRDEKNDVPAAKPKGKPVKQPPAKIIVVETLVREVITPMPISNVSAMTIDTQMPSNLKKQESNAEKSNVPELISIDEVDRQITPHSTVIDAKKPTEKIQPIEGNKNKTEMVTKKVEISSTETKSKDEVKPSASKQIQKTDTSKKLDMVAEEATTTSPAVIGRSEEAKDATSHGKKSSDETTTRPRRRLSVKTTKDGVRRASIAAVEGSKIEPPIQSIDIAPIASIKTQRRPSDSEALLKKISPTKETSDAIAKKTSGITTRRASLKRTEATAAKSETTTTATTAASNALPVNEQIIAAAATTATTHTSKTTAIAQTTTAASASSDVAKNSDKDAVTLITPIATKNTTTTTTTAATLTPSKIIDDASLSSSSSSQSIASDHTPPPSNSITRTKSDAIEDSSSSKIVEEIKLTAAVERVVAAPTTATTLAASSATSSSLSPASPAAVAVFAPVTTNTHLSSTPTNVASSQAQQQQQSNVASDKCNSVVGGATTTPTTPTTTSDIKLNSSAVVTDSKRAASTSPIPPVASADVDKRQKEEQKTQSLKLLNEVKQLTSTVVQTTISALRDIKATITATAATTTTAAANLIANTTTQAPNEVPPVASSESGNERIHHAIIIPADIADDNNSSNNSANNAVNKRAATTNEQQQVASVEAINAATAPAATTKTAAVASADKKAEADTVAVLAATAAAVVIAAETFKIEVPPAATHIVKVDAATTTTRTTTAETTLSSATTIAVAASSIASVVAEATTTTAVVESTSISSAISSTTTTSTTTLAAATKDSDAPSISNSLPTTSERDVTSNLPAATVAPIVTADEAKKLDENNNSTDTASSNEAQQLDAEMPELQVLPAPVQAVLVEHIEPDVEDGDLKGAVGVIVPPKKKVIVKKILRKSKKSTATSSTTAAPATGDDAAESAAEQKPSENELDVGELIEEEEIEIEVDDEAAAPPPPPPAPPKKPRKIKKKVIIKRQQRRLSNSDPFFPNNNDDDDDAPGAEPPAIETLERAISYVTDSSSDEEDTSINSTESAPPTPLKTCMHAREYKVGDLVLYAERFRKTQVRWKRGRVLERITSISYKLDVEGKEVPAHISYIKKYTGRKVHFGSKEYLEIDYEQIAEEEHKARSYSIWNMV